MNIEFYKEIEDLVDIHENCLSNGKEIVCFKLIRDIVDGKVLKENVSIAKKKLAQEQLAESLEWLESIGISVKYKEDFINMFKSLF